MCDSIVMQMDLKRRLGQVKLLERVLDEHMCYENTRRRHFTEVIEKQCEERSVA